MANNDEIRFISSSIKLPPFSSSHSLHSPISFLKHTPLCNFAKLPFNFSFNFNPQPINFISQFVQNQPFLHHMFKKPPIFCSATLVLSDSEPGQSKSGDESGTVVQYKGDEFGPVIQSKNVGSTRTAEEERVLISEVLVRNKDGEELERKDIEAEALNALKASRANSALTVDEVQEDVHRIIASGYFMSCIPVAVDTRDGIRLIFQVEPNQEFRGLVCEGANVLPLKFIEDAFRDGYGKIVNIRRLDEVINSIDSWYMERGLFGMVSGVEILSGGIIKLQASEAEVNNVSIRFLDKTGEPTVGKTRPETILRQLTTKKGQVYSMIQGKRDVDTLLAIGVMDDVSIIPQPSTDTGKVDLTMNIVERKSGGGISAGGGLSSGITSGPLAGLIGSIAIYHKNLFGRNQKLDLSLERGQINSIFRINYTDPWIEGDDKRTSRAIMVQNSRTPGQLVHGNQPNNSGLTIERNTAGIECSWPKWNGTAGIMGPVEGAIFADCGTDLGSGPTVPDEKDFTLEELLDEDDIIQECKALNCRLINFLREKSRVKQLIQYIVEEAPEGTERQRAIKFPFIACEIFTCGVDIILKALIEDEELMGLLFSYLEPERPHSTLLAGYFSKVVVCLLLRKTTPLMNYIRAHQDIIKRLVDLIGITSIMEVLIRLIGADEHIYTSYADSMQWLEDMNVLEMIVDKFSSSDCPVVHTNAAETLCAITRYAPPGLASKISSPSFIERLFQHALEDSRPKSVLVNLLSVCISLLDPKRLTSGNLLKLLNISPEGHVLLTTYGKLQPPLGKHRLKQLYLAGNQITSLKSLPELPNLEFLSVAQNKLKSLSMASQPRLQVLAASKNKISTLKGFPHLPALEHLRVEENPILKTPHLEAASILLVGPTLKKFNDRDLSREEIAIAKRYPSHAALCIRGGWELCRPEQAVDSTFKFLLEQWKEQLPTGYLLQKAFVDQPFEEDACCCHFEFVRDINEDSGAVLTLKYQWLIGERSPSNFKAIPGACREVYSPKHEDIGRILKVECTPILGDTEYPTIFAISSPVSPGTVIPKVMKLDVSGELVEGNTITGYAEVAWCWGTPGKGVATWLRRRWNSSPVVIAGAEEEEYQLSLDDIDSCLVYMYTPVTEEGAKGEPRYAITDYVKAALPPSLNFLSITGDYSESGVLTASYSYIGGHEGKSIYNWYLHEVENDTGALIPEVSGLLQYRIPKDAIGKFISFTCTPVRDDGVSGEARTCTGQERIRPGSPRLLSLQIIGTAVEGTTLNVEKKYWGGEEGESIYRWFRTSSSGTPNEINGATSSSYMLSVDDIGFFISVSCEPIRSDWARGPIVLSEQVGPIVPGPPTCRSLEFQGSLVEGERLGFIASYSGGVKGDCLYEWYIVKDRGHKEKLQVGEFLDLAIDEVEDCVELVYTPVRSDGLKGSPKTLISSPVSPGEPLGVELVIPDCCEGEEVVPKTKYYGGQEGVGIYTWFRTKDKLHESSLMELPNNFESADMCGQALLYTPTLEDVGSYLALYWLPTRSDGKCGIPLVSICESPVIPALPIVSNVHVKKLSSSTYIGEGDYFGGHEGASLFSWYRQSEEGTSVLIAGANSKTYEVSEDDYNCRLLFGYTPLRSDSVVGELRLSEPTDVVFPELPRIEVLALTGEAVEREILTALEVIPKSEHQQLVWGKYKKESIYQWFFSSEVGSDETFEPIPSQRSCSYKVRFEDIGRYLKCECIVTDVFGRSSEVAQVETASVLPGVPRMDNLEIEGRGFHTNLYAVRGIYNGGREGRSRIQWLRSMVGSPDLISIPGETGRIYEANVDDVGYRLVANYTPVRDDGVEGQPVSASTDPISVEPDVLKEVKQKLDLGSVKFEILCDKDRSPIRVPGVGSLERRILKVNTKRVKVVKPGSKTSFPTTKIRGTYVPPFHVELFRNDQRRLRIVVDSDNEVDLMVQTRHLRDVVVLVIRGLAQRFNSTSLNTPNNRAMIDASCAIM